MNNYEEWAQLVAKKLKGEADLITAIEKEELDDAGATEAFSRAVLENFLPENFGIGDGRIVDAFGNYSEYFDLIIYNRDFPRIGLRGTHNTYLYESVLAAFAIRAKFLRKTFFDAMNACASLGELEANVDKTVLVRLAKKNGLTLGPKKKFIHRDPLHTARFDLIGRPPAFVFGFSGFKTSYRQLQENIELWIEHREHEVGEVEMKTLPAVIATQGVFAWRNAAPLALSNREMLGIGTDDAPVRLIVLQLLYLLNRRLNVTSDGYGLKPNLKAYLSQFSPPKFEVGAGEVPEPGDTGKPQTAPDAAKKPSAAKKSEVSASEKSHQFEAALDRARERFESSSPAEAPAPKAPPSSPFAQPSPAPKAAAPEPKSEPAPAAPEPPAPSAEPVAAKPAEPEPEPAAEFDKPSPFASAPRPSAADGDSPAPARRPTAKAAFDQSPFASAPTGGGDPGLTSEIPTPDPDVFNQPLPDESDMAAAEPEPSAPTPGAAPEKRAAIRPEPSASPPEAAPEKRAAADVIPPKPPVDFDLTSEAASKAGSKPPPVEPEPVDDDDPFIQTVVMPPPNGDGEQKEAPRNSTDAFIARVKQQLSSPDSTQFQADEDADKDKKQDPFTSTIPQ